MKQEVDFVKLTLWLAGLLALAFFGGWVWYGRKITQAEREIAEARGICGEVGKLAKDIRVLDEERRSDKAPKDTADQVGILSYFSEQAREAKFNPGQDYAFKPRDPERNRGGYVDQLFVIEFKKDRPKPRANLMAFLFNCERSRRIKLVKARLSLAEENAVADLWNADSLTFAKRDPIKAPAN